MEAVRRRPEFCHHLVARRGRPAQGVHGRFQLGGQLLQLPAHRGQVIQSWGNLVQGIGKVCRHYVDRADIVVRKVGDVIQHPLRAVSRIVREAAHGLQQGGHIAPGALGVADRPVNQAVQGLQLSPGEDRSVTGIQREGIHSHEGQAGGDGALEAEQGPLAALEGQEIERRLRLEAEQSLREMELVLLLTLDLAEILRL